MKSKNPKLAKLTKVKAPAKGKAVPFGKAAKGAKPMPFSFKKGK